MPLIIMYGFSFLLIGIFCRTLIFGARRKGTDCGNSSSKS